MNLRGILVGCDQVREWLLPWWWENYRQENDLPVAFADFGMSKKAQAWCRKKGTIYSLPIERRVATKGEISPFLAKKWEKSISPFWELRQAWFKKPSALLHSPFLQTIWIDLDCEILSSLNPIYEYLDKEHTMGLARTGNVYNSGVIVFANGSPILQKWAEISLAKNHKFLSDQNALTHVISKGKWEIREIPELYNWQMYKGIPIGAKVLHWSAQWGKDYIKKHGGLRKTLKQFLLA